MKRYLQQEFLKIEHFTARRWRHPVHNHNHFEIIYIHRGAGMHCLSDQHHQYADKNLFLLAPCDHHSFDITKETEFTFLKFTNTYLRGVGNVRLEKQWNQKIDLLLTSAQRSQFNLIRSENDALQIDRLFTVIVEEWQATGNANSEPMFLLLQSLLSIIMRGLRRLPAVPGARRGEKITEVLNYLHEQMKTPDELRLEKLAARFGYSKHYFGIFFKEQTGSSLREYISRHKLSLVENRLQHSSLSMKEISNELGFTDLSHFNKFYRRFKGVSPSQARRLNAIPPQRYSTT